MSDLDLRAIMPMTLVFGSVLLAIAVPVVAEWVWPWRTPQSVIDALADEAERRAPRHPAGYALDQIDRGWWRCEPWTRGRWRRVLRTLERRARARGAGRG